MHIAENRCFSNMHAFNMYIVETTHITEFEQLKFLFQYLFQFQCILFKPSLWLNCLN